MSKGNNNKKQNKSQKSSKDCLDIGFINKHCDILIENMYKFGINTPDRIKYFLAQCYHETDGFRYFKENLNYSEEGLRSVFPKYFNKSNAREYARKPQKIANVIYGNRFGNKNPGDGAKYIGRGLIQITFHDNYKQIGKMIGVDIINNPDLVSDDPEVAIKSACAFFKWKKLNSYADKNDMSKISKIIQGSLRTLNKRIEVLNKINKSPKFQKICNAMNDYIQNKKDSSNPNLPSSLFRLDNRDIYVKALKNNIKYAKDRGPNNNNSSTSSSSNNGSSRLFSLDNSDFYIKRLKEQIKYKKSKENDSDEDSNSSSTSSSLYPPNKKDIYFKKDFNNNEPPPTPPSSLSLENENIYVKELEKQIKYNKVINSNIIKEKIGNHKNVNKLGGIDFSNINEILKSCRNIKFQGLVENNCLFLFKKKCMNSNKHSTFINLEDVAVILKILYDPHIKYKSISFSLDPYEPTNPYGPYMRKVFYPDEIEKKQILQGTKIGEDMFKADYLLKQMSLGYNSDNKTIFDYPYQLQRKGLKPMQSSNESNGKFNRLWVVTKKIESISNKSGLFCVNGIKLGVDAREMEISQNGTLTDRKNQNFNSPCYNFANIFSDLYDEIAEYYNIFNRLKEIAGALAVAKYIYDNHYPIDYNLIEKIYKSTLSPNYQYVVNSIYHYDEKINNENRILSLNEAVDHYLTENNMFINQYNIEMVKNHLINNNIKYKVERRNSLRKYVFGGIDLWKGLIENEYNVLNESNNSISTIDDEDSYTKILSVKKNKLKIDLTDCNVFEFPFLIKNKKCSICNINLDMPDLKINEKYKNAYKTLNAQYCYEHNPFKCEICDEFINGKYLTINEKNYHPKCLKCVYCRKILMENICKSDEGFIHKECLEDYKNDILEKELRYIYDNCPNCEFCDEKITDEYNIINNYKIHKKCIEKIKKKGVDQGKIYILEGITSKCYICKKIIIEDGIRTINGLSHIECLNFIMFIIYAFIDILNKARYS